MRILENGKFRELTEKDKLYNVIKKITEKAKGQTNSESNK